MYARLTLLEIDTLRVDVGQAVDLFERQVLPELRELPEYAGVVVLTTPTGEAALVSFWHSAEAAEAGAVEGFYPETLARYMTLFKSPPGRARYEVALRDGVPSAAP